MSIDYSVFISGVKEKYDKPELLEKRLEIEANVISSIYSDLLLLDDCNLDPTSFLTKDGRFYFSLAQDIRNKKFYVIDEVTILSNSKDKVVEKFNDRGGWETIQNMIDVTNTSNFDIYLDLLHRENIILGLYKDGFNLFEEIEYGDKKLTPIKVFRKFTADEVIDFYETVLTNYGTGYSSEVLEDEEMDLDDKFLEDCQQGMESGVPFADMGYDINGELISIFPFLSAQIGGFNEQGLHMIGGFSGCGKSTILISIISALVANGRKCVIVSNEETINRYKIKWTVFLMARYANYYKLTKKRLTSGDIDAESKKQYKIVQKYWRDNFKGKIKFIAINDASIKTVVKKIRENVLRYGYDTYAYDTFKIQNVDMSNARQDLALVRDSRELDKLCKKYNLIGLASIQLSESQKGRLFLTSSSLSNSKQVKEILTTLILIRNAYDQEFDPKSSYYMQPFRWKKKANGDGWYQEEYTPKEGQNFKVCFIEKSRGGETSLDSGNAYLLRFDGDHSCTYETCIVRPKFGEIK